MAEESKIIAGTEEVIAPVETQDRGLFDFMGKKEPQEEVISTEFDQKVHVSEPEAPKVEEKKEGLFEKLHRSTSSSSSSSSDEEGEEGAEKKKKKKKEKKAEEEIDSSIPIEKCDEPAVLDEKKGFLEKIKEKLPGQHKKPEEVAVVEVEVEPTEGESKAEKKGILEKIKEKLPGYHPKSAEGDALN